MARSNLSFPFVFSYHLFFRFDPTSGICGAATGPLLEAEADETNPGSMGIAPGRFGTFGGIVSLETLSGAQGCYTARGAETMTRTYMSPKQS